MVSTLCPQHKAGKKYPGALIFVGKEAAFLLDSQALVLPSWEASEISTAPQVIHAQGRRLGDSQLFR